MYKLVLLISLLSLMPVWAENGAVTSATAASPAPKATEKPKEKEPEVMTGKNLKNGLAKIVVKENGTTEKNIIDLFDKQKDTLVIMVKPNCIFCESFMKTAAQSKLKSRIKTIVLIDKAHATDEEFKRKMNKHAGLAATWVYDTENAFHDDLGFASYPRFVIFGSSGIVKADQIGLVIPKNREALKKKPMDELLVTLSDETINWIKRGGKKQ